MIGSIVATLDPNPECIQTAIKCIQEDPAVEIGDLCNMRLPLTIEAGDSKQMLAITRRIQDITGVLFIDVVFVSFDDTPDLVQLQ